MNTQNELNNLRAELSGIIKELESIADGLRNEFRGLSTNVYAAKIEAVANEYRNYLSQLNAAYVKKGESNEGGGS